MTKKSMINEIPELIDVDGLAKKFNTTKKTILNWEKKGIINAYAPERKHYYKVSEVNEMIERSYVK